MYIRHIRNMQVIKAITLMSPSNKVSEFFRKSNNQDGGKNKKDHEVMKKVQKQLEKIEKFVSMHVKMSIILMFLKLLQKLEENVII